MAKSKKLEDLVELFEKESLISEVFLVSRPHPRLFKAEEGYKVIKNLGCSKLHTLIEDLQNTSDSEDGEFKK